MPLLTKGLRSGSVTVGDEVDLLDTTGMPILATTEGDEAEILNEEEITNFKRALGIPSPGLPSKKKEFTKVARSRS